MIGPHLRYLGYVARHKWFVGCECMASGVYWRALKHDWHKLLPSEWFPYVAHFYGRGTGIGTGRNATGHYAAGMTGEDAFDFAWLLHQKRADHHWQWWILPLDDGGTRVLPMSPAARLEMVCDWCGASRAQGYGGWHGVARWYEENGSKMRLHPETRTWVESELARRLAGEPE